MLSIKEQTEIMLAGEAGEQVEVLSLQSHGESWLPMSKIDERGSFVYDWEGNEYRIKTLANWEIVKAAGEGAEIEFCAIDGQEWETKRNCVYWNFLETNYRVKK